MILIDKVVSSEEELRVSQMARLVDILFIGPLLIYVGITGKINKTIATIFIIIALITIIYNGYYLIKYSKPSNNPINQ